ncbi:4a-hydroxytetrahydrobiopterin dehydratase [Rhodococcus wratislaviensis]|uniref:Putative pterin-4-alpha-carbinolamine dehydratase n=3 Tax=Rhodococcus TaxID=1827 RepID=A0AB38F9B0_RHOWR|nr:MULTISPECIES: 4a-hydroxytetrahydrobiopterin dehydratase [Rhodococcus]AII05111.1 pterin-4-alpha-carbinolamine dehydratase [Rhodococcus opacus]REE72519.1 4a-hydroxytetrahydrobiopterin dehydratase [Rhodococcus wratislaviensis]WAM16360.1 4a-hydroxytetrahydrobiopterin dehydratase [Rhodococcus sp. JS3073]SPZ38139.1 pterin-4-alpha-carbinolamine dehydratase [Rhodococcus wratislaviensis]GAF45218.1 putative pterin-4-alpha-carbinolamine dehydratase [Rhodococcus wratislaviensis NBRC 100605]
MAELLSDGEIDTALAELPGWRRAGDSLVRTVESPSFPDAVELVGKVAEAAEAANHHPDIDIRWRKVTYTLSTHSAGGLTQLDLDLAAQIDALAG